MYKIQNNHSYPKLGCATTQAISYIPYGEVFVEQQAGGWSSPYLFNAKELDSETGLYYYGARYLDPSDAMWLSVDPLWEKYVGMTPYQYCMGNPVKLVDVDGDSVCIYGTESTSAFIQLQSSVENELKLEINNDGWLSAKKISQNELSSNAMQLLEAIDNSSINVYIETTTSKQTKDGGLFVGGAFMGNKFESNGKINAKQLVNPEVLNNLSTANNQKGTDMLHELTEAYQGAIISRSMGIESPRSGIEGSIYNLAHIYATPQSGIVNEYLYNREGSLIHDYNNVYNVEYISNNKIIMTFP